jgi:prevent-host-death family protein
MENVSVAELKARLSHYLREVREGASFTVVSRDIPVATLEPWNPQPVDDLKTTPADPYAPGLLETLLGPAGLFVDGAELIRRDREASDDRLGDAGPGARGAERQVGDEDER